MRWIVTYCYDQPHIQIVDHRIFDTDPLLATIRDEMTSMEVYAKKQVFYSSRWYLIMRIE